MKIKNIDGLSADDLQQAVKEGARFIYYVWTISAVVLTFKRTTGVYLVYADDNKVKKGLGCTLVTVLFGWWGIPFGPKYTLESIRINLRGGKDVTDEVMSVVTGYVSFDQYNRSTT